VIGILGGTFDPIHFGHLRPALEIVEMLSLEELRFIPSAKPPHRWQPVASAEDRLAMVKLAIQAYEKFTLDDREYHREGASYTIDTLKSVRTDIGNHKPLCMIIGLDAFQSFTSWKDWQKILDETHLVVSTRPGYQLAESEEDWVKTRLSSDPDELQKKPSGKILFCEVTQLDISATNIRKQLLNGNSCSYMTPEKVCEYINKHKLYTN
jgi:nicotinate-nucleotide adenylyltransferase